MISTRIGKPYHEKLMNINVGEKITNNDQEIRCIEYYMDRKTFDYFDHRDLVDWTKIFRGIRFRTHYGSEKIEVTLINFYVLSTNLIFQLSQATFDQLDHEIEKRIMNTIGGQHDNKRSNQKT